MCSTHQRFQSMPSWSPISNGSDRMLKIFGARSVVNGLRQTAAPCAACSAKTSFRWS